jgi:predicted nucleic acid-binding protein
LLNEPGAARVEEIFGSGDCVVMHAVNLVELEYLTLRRGEAELDAAIARLDAVGVKIVREMTASLLLRAARTKAYHAPISLGDVFAVALATDRGGTLLTTDRGSLEKIQAAGICAIEFLP